MLAGWFGVFVVDDWSASFLFEAAEGTLGSGGLVGVLIERELGVVVGWRRKVALLISF